MHAINETNALYFYPHTLRFEPSSSISDRERNGRWVDGHYVSIASSRPPVGLPGDAATDIPKDVQQERDDERMDDDGAHVVAADDET